ncbi:recombinase family protein [Neobacillus sp. SM06]|uniref:recombinase family protein n=1 Tax=Neobacillus sp. SM06 TaxID=3422492 RepID=UPI003D2C2A30
MLSNVDAFIYLRKSRKDLEEEKKQAENGNHYDTLERHRSQLLELAKVRKVTVKGIYEEVVSGEYISERPEMQKMLREIEIGSADAVLCMDLDRLGRGDMVDQGTIYRIFKNSETVIITPTEVIDPQDENQELTFSIKSLIAREELKTIVKRMQRGRRQSAKEGKSVSKKPPFGYIRNENLKLSPDPDTSWVVEMVFKMAADGSGRRSIAEKLDQLGIKPPQKETWDPSTVTSILRNEVYLGMIIWGKVKYTKINGKYQRKKMPREHWSISENAHEPLVSQDLFSQANEAIAGRWRPHLKKNTQLTNPLAGLLFCENCGKAIVLQPRPNRPNDQLRCFNHHCKGVQKGCNLSVVEQRILSTLETLIDQFEIPENSQKKRKSTLLAKEKALTKMLDEKQEIDSQNDSIHELLEKRIYTIETFLQRQSVIKEKLDHINKKITDLKEEIEQEKQQQLATINFVPKVKSVLEAYYSTNEVEKKNRLLKSVIDKATYLRKKEWTKPDQIEIKLYTKI